MPCLSRYSLSDLKASTSVSKAPSQLLWPLQVDDGALRQRHFLAEGVARLQRRRRVRLGAGGWPAARRLAPSAGAGKRAKARAERAIGAARRGCTASRFSVVCGVRRFAGIGRHFSMASGQSAFIRHINRAKPGQGSHSANSIAIMGALANQPFVKMNGIGNEIVVVDLRATRRRRSQPRRRARRRRRKARPTIS